MFQTYCICPFSGASLPNELDLKMVLAGPDCLCSVQHWLNHTCVQTIHLSMMFSFKSIVTTKDIDVFPIRNCEEASSDQIKRTTYTVISSTKLLKRSNETDTCTCTD